MDHIPLPSDPVRSPPRIRYYCIAEYDRGDFGTYPERLGLTQTEILTASTRARVGSTVSKSVAAFLQQWLFFGLLHAAFGDAIVFQDFIDEESSTKYVHTRKLLAYTDQHVSKGESGLLTASDMLRLNRSLKTANLASIFFAKTPAPALDPYFLLSLSLLGQFLTNLEHFFLRRHYFVWRTPRFDYNPDLLQHTDILQHEMIEHGWCPRAIAKSKQLMGLNYYYFTSFLRNLQQDRHHGVCTDTQCLATQIQKSSYRTEHSSDCCSCSFQGFEQAAVEKVLDGGELPLVAWDRSNGVVKLISRTFDATYVAISHVWSDGLGNPHANTMPSCQLEVLNDLVQNLYPGEAGQIPFWIDTLCCPAIPSKGKQIAIRKMRDTYACADKVLVLDKGLRSLETTGRSVSELAFYIHSSNWSSRLWTFQEAALPKTLIFQFSNETLDSRRIRSTVREVRSEYTNALGNINDLHRIYDSMRGGYGRSENPYKPPVMNLWACSQALAARTTSVQEDESLCLASLMAIDPAPFLGVNPRDRMMHFWAQLPHVSEYLMYYEYSRLDSIGFRWAPKTLLGVGSEQSYNDESASPTKDGLLVNAYSITLQGLKPPLSHRIDGRLWIRGTDDRWDYYLMKASETSMAQGYKHFTVLEGHFSRITLLATTNICSSDESSGAYFVMVFVTGERDGITYARRADSGMIFKADHPTHQENGFHVAQVGRKKFLQNPENDSVTREGENHLLDNDYVAVVGDWTDQKSQWCID